MKQGEELEKIKVNNFYLQHSSTLHREQSTMINCTIKDHLEKLQHGHDQILCKRFGNTALQSLMPKMKNDLFSIFIVFLVKISTNQNLLT